jgi:hypothetical protein
MLIGRLPMTANDGNCLLLLLCQDEGEHPHPAPGWGCVLRDAVWGWEENVSVARYGKRGRTMTDYALKRDLSSSRFEEVASGA